MSRYRSRSIEPRPGDMPVRMVPGQCEAMKLSPDNRWRQCEARATQGRMCKEHAEGYAATWGSVAIPN